jgi:F0F1-type ATP synthase assembly protein I
MRTIFPFLFFFVLSYTAALAQQDTAKVGIYLTNLYDFNLGDGCYTAEFYTWTLYKNTELDFAENQEVTKSKRTSFANALTEDAGEYKWHTKKCTSTILQDWDVRKFPFDKQQLKINLEEVDNDTSELYYQVDIKNSKISDALSLDEWKIDSFKAQSSQVRYNTTYGDPTLEGASVYPAVTFDVFIARTHSWVTFIKLVTGAMVAFLISVMVFYIRPPETETRISLAVGGLFAAVGNKYIVESVVPTTTQTTLIDYIHLLVFAEILFIILMTIVIGVRYYREREDQAHMLEKASFWFSMISFSTVMVALLLSI